MKPDEERHSEAAAALVAHCPREIETPWSTRGSSLLANSVSRFDTVVIGDKGGQVILGIREIHSYKRKRNKTPEASVSEQTRQKGPK